MSVICRLAQPYEIFREAGLRGFWPSDSTLTVAVRWSTRQTTPLARFQRFRGHELADTRGVPRQVWRFCFSEVELPQRADHIQ